MAIKICFNNQIHRFNKLPSDLKALISVITSTFSDQLPKSWSLYYVDSDGDKITISQDQSYQDLIDTESRDPSVSVKLYVEAKEVSEEQISKETEPQVQMNQLAQQPEDFDIILPSSQNQREKTAEADYCYIGQQQSNEVQPRAFPQPENEGYVVDPTTNRKEKTVKKGKKHLTYKALHLFTKLSHQDLSEEKKIQLLTKLKEIEESLSTEERVEFEKKKEEWSTRQLDPQVALEKKEKKERKEKAKNLFKELRNKDLSESERAQVMSQLKELEEKLTPEQKERFEKRREKWAHKTSKRQDKKQFNIFKAFRLLNKMAETAQKGDTQKIGTIREKAFKRISDEEAKKVLEPAFALMTSETSDKESFGKLLDKAREQLLNISHPQDKENVIQEWEKRQEKCRLRRETKNNTEGVEKNREKKQRGNCLEKYSPEVAEKALKIKESVSKGGMKRLCKFVAKSPEGVSVEELITMYLATLDQRSERRANKELKA